jgi:hypothetical protein
MSTPTTEGAGHFVWHDHTSDDPDAATAFYTRLFGWELELWKPGEVDYPMIKNGETHQGGFVKPQMEVRPQWTGYVQVGDVDAAVLRAQERGATVHTTPTDIPDVGRLAVLADPQGATFALIQQLSGNTSRPERPAPTGSFAWDELITTDVEAAKSFYGYVLNWSAETWPIGEIPYDLFKASGRDAAGLMATPPGVATPAQWMTYIAVDDIDLSVEAARELGATLHAGPDDIPEVGRIAVLADTTSAIFGLFAGNGN